LNHRDTETQRRQKRDKEKSEKEAVRFPVVFVLVVFLSFF